MIINRVTLNKIRENLYEIPRQGEMKVPGRIYISELMLRDFENDEALKQVMNVACLPGILKYSLAMPDIHWGYGFPIGGVAATDINYGVISPGGVGYDINCGVRLVTTSLSYEFVKDKIDKLITSLFNNIPTGVGSKGAIKKLSEPEMRDLLNNGSEWAIERDLGKDEDLLYTEENGKLKDASADAVSARALERGFDQVGTLGSGNHFLEVDVVSDIYDEKKAEIYGLRKNQIVVLIHTGSRGLGYQVCDDYLKKILRKNSDYGFNLPDKQLACAPLYSKEGKEYLAAMQAAANFAWNNRQVIMNLAEKSFLQSFNMTKKELEFRLIYDVCHNIAKIEDHNIDGIERKVCVHRKGATRAFSPGHPLIPSRYKEAGQPVLIPGDMGRYSFVAAGTEKAMKETFGSSCHGAGRNLSRHKALSSAKGRNIVDEMQKKGIIVKSKVQKTLAEEMSEAYKNVESVIDVMHNEGITLKVAKLKPLGVIKG